MALEMTYGAATAQERPQYGPRRPKTAQVQREATYKTIQEVSEAPGRSPEAPPHPKLNVFYNLAGASLSVHNGKD